MSNDPVTAYREALAGLSAAEGDVQFYVKLIVQAAELLKKDWRTVLVADGDAKFPPEMGLNPKQPRINGREWPSGGRLAEVLSDWHEARFKARTAYDAIPAEQRAGLPPRP